METMRGQYLELKEKPAVYSPKDEAFIKIVPIGLRFRMTRSTGHLKQDVWRNARRKGWLAG